MFFFIFCKKLLFYLIKFCLFIFLSWPVLRKILECLSGCFEFRPLIYSAGYSNVSQIIGSVIDLYSRYNHQEFLLMKNEEFSKYLCPLLRKLINYSQDIQICKILVECTRFGCIQVYLKFCIINKFFIYFLSH